jgi:hypothetical protein
MTCEQVRERISDLLADGATHLPAEVVAHQKSCVTCQDFCHSQQKLFRSLDARLQTTANAAVPPSLIPTVRARIQDVAPRGAWIHAWLPAGAAAVVLLGAIAVPVLHRLGGKTVSPPVRLSDRIGNAPVMGGQVQAAVRPGLSTPSVTRAAHSGRTASRDISTPAHMGVLFDKEEARGLSRFVRSIDQKPALAQGFLKAAALPPDETKPAAPIEIAGLNVEPLTDENR